MSKLEQAFIERMKEEAHTGDEENDHYVADKLLCDFLKKLGYDQLVEEYETVSKWYS